MPLIYITGISGSGKSSVCKELKHRGYAAYDTDHDGIAFFYHNETGEPITEPVAPEDRTPEWRLKHIWKAKREDVEKLAEEAKDKLVFLCGVTNNDADELWDLFDHVFAFLMPSIPVYTIHLPEYQVSTKPDYKAIGKVIDTELKKHFMGQMVGLRALGSQEHPDKSIDELIEIIKRDGTDRYDPHRNGDRYDNIENKHIDLFLLRRKISERSKIFWQLAWSFYESPLKLRGQPVRIDTLVIYDLTKLKSIRTTHTHEGYPVTKQDGFVFRESSNKAEAVLGIFKITG